MAGAIPKPLVWVSSLLYAGALCAGLYYRAAGLCAPDPLGATVFVAALVFLLAAERLGGRRLGPLSAQQAAVGMLVLRIAVLEVVASADCSGFARTLYLIIPFAGYFVLGRRAGYALAALYLGAFVLRLSIVVPAWYTNQEAISDLLMFSIGLVFALSTAGIASDAEANRRRAQQLLGELEISHQQLQRSAAQVAELAAAEERNRLARDIHDSLGHYLTAISIQLEKAAAFRQRDPRQAEQALLDARRAARQALQDVRQSVSALRHSGEAFSLEEALADLAHTARSDQLSVDLQFQGAEAGYPRLVLMSLYRAAQEGLTNIQKHARATRATISVVLDADQARLAIDDDGLGFDPELIERLPARRQEHFGLLGLRERLELVEGTLRVTSAPDHGTRLRIQVPKQPQTLAQAALAAGEAGQ